MTGFSCIECIGGRDVSTVKPVFSANSELLFVANGNKVDIHGYGGDFIQSLNSEVATSENIVALFLHPLNNKHLVAVFENSHVVTWIADTGSIGSTCRLQPKDPVFKVVNARCHVNVIDDSTVDIFALVQLEGETSKVVMKVFSGETGEEKVIHHKAFKSLVFQDVGSSNVLAFGGPEHIKSCNGKIISGRYLAVITGPKLYVMILRCIFEPGFEQEMAIHDRQEIRLKHCWYQLGGGRQYSSVTCAPQDYNISVGDNTGRVVVYTGVFLHAEDTRHVHESSTTDRKQRVRHLSVDKLDEESSQDEDEDETRKQGNKKPVTPVKKKSTVSRTMSWAITTVYHWHSFPVLDVMYSETGNFIYSGGGERALAEWTLPHCNKPRTLPRLPGTITNITGAASGQMVLSTRDNSLHIIDQTSLMLKKVVTSIQRLVRDEYQLSKPESGVRASAMSSFLTHDPRTSSLVLNARKGHVQFYNINSSSLLFNMDITEENIVSELHHETVTSDRDRQGTLVSHSDVVCVRLSWDGQCLGSVQALDGVYVLKFWNYCAENKMFKLSTVISKPHSGLPVIDLQFSPSRSQFNDPHTYTCVSTGANGQYTVWSCTYKDGSVSWSKDKEDSYHGLPAGPVGFSQDGSSLAVGFGPCLTLWDRAFELKCSLSHVCDKSETHFIRFLEWAQGPDCSHLLVGSCSNWVRVWDTVLGHNVWQVPLQATLLVSDPGTSYMAVFTNTQKIYVFKPSSPKPDSIISAKGHNRAVAACFVSNPGVTSFEEKETGPDNTSAWYEATQLYFVTSHMELMFVKLLNPFEDQSLPSSPSLPLSLAPLQAKTPFSAMIAREVTEEEQSKDKMKRERMEEGQYENAANMGIIDKFLTFKPMSMAPLELLCTELIKSTLNKKTKSQSSSNPNTKNETENEYENEELDVISHPYEHTQSTLNPLDDSCLMWIQNLV
uniref:WD repeat-containing protein 75 n=1 Tax=Cacopsylla melanoneura TaxID=428564 RepID=A0A8D8S1I8_9HEMI